MQRRSRNKDWADKIANELKAFLALLIFHGIIGKPTNQMYFSRKEVLETPVFGELISQKRLLF